MALILPSAPEAISFTSLRRNGHRHVFDGLYIISIFLKVNDVNDIIKSVNCFVRQEETVLVPFFKSVHCQKEHHCTLFISKGCILVP